MGIFSCNIKGNLSNIMLMKKIIFVFVVLYVSLVFSEGKKLRPSAVPVNIKPKAHSDTAAGFGYNNVTVESDWKDNFFTSESEDIGKIKYTGHHLTAGYLINEKGKKAEEFDLFVGVLKVEEKTKSYTSSVINKTVKLDFDGSGYDIGGRYILSKNLKKLKKHENFIIDMNYAMSLHAAFFYTKSTVSAESLDGLNKNVYEEKDYGIFLRPVIALQPIWYVSEYVSLIPFVGIGTKVSVAYYYWKDKEYINNGTASSEENLDWDWNVVPSFSGIEPTLGFDMSVIFNKKTKHGVDVGGSLSKIMGGNDASFTEFHVMYSFPFTI